MPSLETDDVIAAERARAVAHTTDDLATLAELFDEDYHYVHGSGLTETKATYLAFMAAGKVRFVAIEHDDLVVHRLGEVAVLTGNALVTLQSGASRRSIPNRFTATWVRRGGRWKLLTFQYTNIAG